MQAIEIAVFSPRTLSIEQSASIAVPPGLFDADGDAILDPGAMREIIGQLIRSIRPKPATIHLSLPATLLRMVEMPKMDPAGLYVSLSSEAERYKSFDNAEAVVDFALVDNPHIPPNQQEVVFGAVRSDTLGTYLRIFKELRVKLASVGLEPVNVLRAMAGSGVLDGVVQQIGEDSHWGLIQVEPTRVRLSVWLRDQLIELRETAMLTDEFGIATPDSIVVEDMLEEIRRTGKAAQPLLWLTYNMPPVMDQILSHRLDCPFRPAPLGEALTLPQPLTLPTAGIAMKSSVDFPFPIDLSVGLSKTGISLPGATSIESGSESGGPEWLIPAGILSLVLGGLVTGGLYAAAYTSGLQLPDLSSKRDEAKLEVGTLSAKERELQKKVELDNTLLDMVKKASVRNRIYVDLTEDLKHKTPEKVWVHTLKVDDALEMDGRSLSHQSVINFAESFDQAPYLKAITIDSIKEARLAGTTIFDFKISGNIFLNPALADVPSSDGENGSAGSGDESSSPSTDAGDGKSGV